MIPAIAPFTVPGVATRASSVVNRSMPPVFSSTPIRTLTPHTMTITAHGTWWIHFVSSPSPDRMSTLAAAKAVSPGLSLNATTATIQSASTPRVPQ